MRTSGPWFRGPIQAEAGREEVQRQTMFPSHLGSAQPACLLGSLGAFGPICPGLGVERTTRITTALWGHWRPRPSPSNLTFTMW